MCGDGEEVEVDEYGWTAELESEHGDRWNEQAEELRQIRERADG